MSDVINKDEKNIKRVLVWYDLETNLIIGEEEIKNLDLNKLRNIFDIKDIYNPETDIIYDEDVDPYMYYIYKIDGNHACKLRSYFNHHIDLNEYYYSICAYWKDL